MNSNITNETPLSCIVIRAYINSRLAHQFEADKYATLSTVGDCSNVLLEKKIFKASIEDLVKWTLFYGAEMEILEPLQLREQVKERVKYAIDFFYGNSPSRKHLAPLQEVYTSSGISAEEELYSIIEKKFQIVSI